MNERLIVVSASKQGSLDEDRGANLGNLGHPERILVLKGNDAVLGICVQKDFQNPASIAAVSVKEFLLLNTASPVFPREHLLLEGDITYDIKDIPVRKLVGIEFPQF